MLLAPIPFEYAKLLDPCERVRKPRKRAPGTRRVRRDRAA